MSEFSGINELNCLEHNLSSWSESKSKIILKLVEGKKLLDVGCGIGTFTRSFVNSGFQVVGIDISEMCLKKARKIKAKFFLESITELNFLSRFLNYFDSITALDVIEHIEDDKKAIKNIRNLLKPHGVFVLTVPAFQCLYSKHDVKVGHFRRYSFYRVSKLLLDNGFRIEKIFYWNLPGLFGWLICKILNKNPVQLADRKINKIYGIWFRIEEKIKIPFGLTIFVKARKV